MCTSTSSSSSSSSAPGKKEPTMVRAKHILVDSEDMLDTVEKQIADGKGTFSDLARLVSTCSSKARGGDLGWFRRNVMVKEFERAAFGNPPGSTVRVKTDFGWHLILVEEHAIASTSITVQEFAVRKDDPDMQRIDVREQAELDVASLPGFVHLPMGEFESWADDFENGKFNLDKKKETVVMCHHGMRSANFCSFLAQQGFEHVRNLTGGIHAYATEIDSTVSTYGQ